MRAKPLPMETVATQTDACSEDEFYWDRMSLASFVTNDDDDDVDSVVTLSEDEMERCRAASSQTELAVYSDGSSSWRLSCAGLSDDDGYDVIDDDTDDSCDVFDDSFARRELRRRVQQDSELSSFRHVDGKPPAQSDAQKKLSPIFEFQTLSRDTPTPPAVVAATSGSVETSPSHLCQYCGRVVSMGQSLPPNVRRSVPRMGTRMGPRPQPTAMCTCGVRTRDVQRCSSQGGRPARGVCLGTASLSDSEKSSATLTEVQYRRTWSSDGDAPAAGIDSSSSDSHSASELSPTSSEPDPARNDHCPETTQVADPGQVPAPGSKPGVRSAGAAAARRLAYEQFADVMYTNRANLEHTIAVQQRLFQQQLAHPAFHGYINAALPPPLPPRPGAKKTSAEESRVRGQKSESQLEWVVRRRADGTRYITRRSSSSRHHSRRPRDVISAADRKQATTTTTSGDGGPVTSETKPPTTGTGRAGSGKRKGGKDAPEDGTGLVRNARMCSEEHRQTHKSVSAFHNASSSASGLKHSQQHSLLAVVTI